MKSRKFLSKLSWCPEEVGLKFSFFNQEEISSYPAKWLKHLVLVQTGLRDINELNKEIHRFKMSQSGLQQVKKICKSSLSLSKPNTLLIVLKMVFPEVTMGLPNYRLTSPEHIDEVFEDVKLRYYDHADEIWLCESNISRHGCNLGGRITICLEAKYTPAFLELIWYTSPRLIDIYRTLSVPYLAASKDPGNLFFKLESFHIPENSNSPAQFHNLVKDYRYILYKLQMYEEKINDFSDILKRNGVKEVVLEFKADDGKFKFIDWDTDAG